MVASPDEGRFRHFQIRVRLLEFQPCLMVGAGNLDRFAVLCEFRGIAGFTVHAEMKDSVFLRFRPRPFSGDVSADCAKHPHAS